MKNVGWTNQQIRLHEEAAKNLCEIKDKVFELMRKQPRISEYEVAQFVLTQFEKRNMKTDYDVPIVAFRENTSYVHYFPEAKSAFKLKDNSLIMIDIWAKMKEKDAPFADITWMAWKGDKIPRVIKKGFKAVAASRDNGLQYIEKSLKENMRVRSSKLAQAMNEVRLSFGMQELMPHSYGHSLGTTTCHGRRGRFLIGSRILITANIAYTIEPGIYIENKFGFRTEIDFYIDESGRLNITTEVQKELVRI